MCSPDTLPLCVYVCVCPCILLLTSLLLSVVFHVHVCSLRGLSLGLWQLFIFPGCTFMNLNNDDDNNSNNNNGHCLIPSGAARPECPAISVAAGVVARRQ